MQDYILLHNRYIENYLQVINLDSPNFIFFSYSHKDMDRIRPVISNLQFLHYNIWYDHNVEGGSEWSDNTAHHIENCRCFIAFISNHYILSGNCKDEMHYARDLEKDQLLIYLEDVQLPSGMAMRLNRMQHISYYADESFDDLMFKLNLFSGFSDCRADGLCSSAEWGTDHLSSGTIPHREVRVKFSSANAESSIETNQSPVGFAEGGRKQGPPSSQPVHYSKETPKSNQKIPADKGKLFSAGKRKLFPAAIMGSVAVVALLIVFLFKFHQSVSAIDPFAPEVFDVAQGQGIYLEYKGYYPTGYLTIINFCEKGTSYSDITYSLSEIEVKSGDVITISAKVNNSNITLSRKSIEYTVGSLPHYLSSPEELTSDQLQKLGDIVQNYLKSNEQDVIIYDGKHEYETKDGTVTYFDINANSYLYLLPGKDSELFVIFDESIDTDYYENGIYVGHKEFNTLIGACEISTLVVDQNGEVSYLCSDPTYMDISDLYTSDQVMNDLYFNEITEELDQEGYKFYSMMRTD